MFLALLGVLLTACPKDEVPQSGCTDPSSLNYDENGDVDNGSCVYARDKFLGSFNVISDNCEGASYIIRIDSSSQDDQKILINNLNNVSALTLTGLVNDNSFVIESINFNGQTISGNGQVNSNVLSIVYQVTASNGYTFSCTVSANKQ